MRLDPAMLRALLRVALLATVVPVAAIELPSRAGNVRFDHGRHIAAEQGRCTGCHHTSTGTEVRETCRDCHLPVSRVLPDSRAAFHGSCIGCHEKLHRAGLATGPSKRCSGCHQPGAGRDGEAPPRQ